MANEAVIIELLGNGGEPVRYTVADANAIPKGTLMYLSGDNTMSIHSGDGQIFVGIAAAEKVALDGSTTLAVYTFGIFDLTDDGNTLALGDLCKLSGTANKIALADEAGALGAREVVGLVLEAAAASEVVAVRVRC